MTESFFDHINNLSVPEALLAYLDKGIAVFPLRPDNPKVPAVKWKPYQTTTPTIFEGRQWIAKWGSDLVLALPTGAHNNLYVLDTDNERATAWVRENAPPTPLRQKTRKGVHFFYCPGLVRFSVGVSHGPDHLRPEGGGSTGIDSRGEGGYVVVAPSTVRQHQYRWEYEPPGAPLPTLDALGQGFFTSSGRVNSQGGRMTPHGVTNAPTARFYNDDGLVGIGCRDDYMRSLTLGIIASEKQETGQLPSAEYVAETAWRTFEQHADTSDGIPKYEHILEKAVYTLGRVANDTIVISDDDDFPSLPADLPEVDLDALPVDTRWKIIILRGHDPGDETLWAGKSECMFAATCVMVRAGMSDELIAAVLLDPDLKISDHVLAQPNPRRYAARQIQRAKEFCNG